MPNLLRSLPVFLLLSAPLLPAQTKGAAGDPLAPTAHTKTADQIDQEWQKSVAKYDTQRNALLKEAERQSNDGPFRPEIGRASCRERV